MICPRCQTENDSARKFCMECGARLASGCPNCGAENPDAAKFCGECGTPLQQALAASPDTGPAPAAAAPATGAAERRLVTVLFADLVGFTTQAQDQDPEDTREFLTRYFDLARTIVERYGGTIEKFIGDAVMAVWGAPTAHEDDAERAVRAALDIVDAVPSLSDQLGVEVRAGVLTGEAAVTIGASGQGMVAGDLVNTASRLQSVAPPGSVLVGEATYRAASGAIDFEEAGEQLLKGKAAPVTAWRARSVVALRGGEGRGTALEPPFVGRDEDLRLVKDLFHATERESKARLVSIVGQAGIGKSRLAWEFEKYIDGVVEQVFWHTGRSPAYGEGISYWALAEMVRSRAGIAETDAPSIARERLRTTAAEWLPDEAERRWVEPRLAALLALEPMPPGSRDELFAAWRTFFERIAERGPTALVFEDIHWADDGMLDFVEELLDRSRNRALFVITLARPELFERRPSFGTMLRSSTAMRLEPLEAAQIAEMVRGTVPGIPDEAVEAIVARAEGVPLYAVETIRMLIDRGALSARPDGRYELTAPIDRLAVPETLHALIAARLDALDEGERRLLQTAAVVGQSFAVDALAAVVDESVDELRQRLDNLVKRQLLHVDIDPRSAERGQYQFVQAVVREVAVNSLARSDRRGLHLAVARHYESLGDEELAGVLASHYVDAYRATPAGPEADALAAQARVSLRGAAERATTLHSHAQALSYLEQALSVTTEPAEQAALHERAAWAAVRLNRVGTAMEHSRAVEQLAEEIGDRLGVLRGISLQATTHLNEHGEQPAIALLRPALEAAADLGPHPDVVTAQAELARALMLGGVLAESVDWCNRVLAAQEVASDEQILEVLITKGTALIPLASVREAEVLLRGAIQVADDRGLFSASLRARNNLLSILALKDLAGAGAVISEGYTIARRYGLLTFVNQLAHVGLSTGFEHGDWDAWIDETGELDAPDFYRGWRLDEVARRASFRGQLDEARPLHDEARRWVGSGSSQAAASLGTSDAAWHVATGNWPAVIDAARVGWSHYDATLDAVGWATAAAFVVGEPAWIREAVEQLERPEWLGRYPDGMRSFAHTGLALLEGRWADARGHFLAARRSLGEAGAQLWLGLLNLAVGSYGRDHVPDAAEAAVAGEEFFARLGARGFAEMYREAITPPPADRTAPSRADRLSRTPAS